MKPVQDGVQCSQFTKRAIAQDTMGDLIMLMIGPLNLESSLTIWKRRENDCIDVRRGGAYHGWHRYTRGLSEGHRAPPSKTIRPKIERPLSSVQHGNGADTEDT